jgi:cytochrome P450
VRLEDIDLADLDNFTAGFPYRYFDVLRQKAPVWFHPPTVQAPGSEGFWVISRHDDVLAVCRDHETFSSERGGERAGGGTTLEDMPSSVGPGVLLNMMDPPRHERFRLLINKGFKPRTIALLEADLRHRTQAILDVVAKKGDCDFLVEVAAELPLQAVVSLLGMPQEDRHQMYRWAITLVDYSDRNVGESSAALQEAVVGLAEYGRDLIAAKRKSPTDDMLSLVIHAELPKADGSPDQLSDLELLRFFNLLIVASSETTQNAIAHGLYALLQHPDQLTLFREDPAIMPSAVEEILRWTSPVSYNRRTATRQTELRGQEIRAGDKVSVWWPSANRDETVFDEPYRFDLKRRPNPHVAFGHGLHHCLGANLARTEMRVMYEELFARFDRMELLGEPEWARSNKHHGIRHLPVRLHVGR